MQTNAERIKESHNNIFGDFIRRVPCIFFFVEHMFYKCTTGVVLILLVIIFSGDFSGMSILTRNYHCRLSFMDIYNSITKNNPII